MKASSVLTAYIFLLDGLKSDYFKCSLRDIGGMEKESFLSSSFVREEDKSI